jgi:hypothetical protein
MNVDTGETLRFAGGFRISIVFNADGSIDADGTGSLFAYYFPGDPSEIGTGWHHISGHLVEHYASDGTYLGNEFSGSSQNLCEALA